MSAPWVDATYRVEAALPTTARLPFPLPFHAVDRVSSTWFRPGLSGLTRLPICSNSVKRLSINLRNN